MNVKSVTRGRKQRADRLSLLLLWANAGVGLRREFGGTFAFFERYAETEAERLIRSAANSGKTAAKAFRS